MLKLASVLSPGKSELRGYLLYNKFTALQHLLTRDQDFSKVNEIYLVALKAMPPYFLHSTYFCIFLKTQVTNERRRVAELVRLLGAAGARLRAVA